MKKIYILLGNPDKEGTLGAYLADAYETAARAAGHEVKRTNIGDLTFDPILHKGYRTIQDLEPDLKQVQEDIRWCDHFVLVYPVWWSGMPALLKGMIDRMWLPAFAFRFKKTKSGKSLPLWNKLLKGKTSRVIVTLKSWPWAEHFMYGDYAGSLTNAVLRFSGFRVRTTEIGNAEALSEKSKMAWNKRISTLARKGT